MLQNLLRAWAPFDDAQHCVVVRGDGAFAWAWDRVLVSQLLAEASAPANAKLHPEALLVEPPAGECARLVGALQGVDAQIWRRGELLASRWWPEVPTQDEWAGWLRGAGAEQPVAESLPSVETLAWQAPWAEGLDQAALLSSTSRLERVALGAALAGLVGLSSAQLHQAWLAYSERGELQLERDRLVAQAAPVITARARALAMASQAELLAAQLAAPLPLEVMQHLAERLPARGVTLKEMELSGTRLRVALDVPADLPRTAIVKELQAPGWFVQVNEVRDLSGRGWIGFDIQIQGLQPPASAPAPVPTGVSPTAAPPGFPGLPNSTPGPPGFRP